MPHGTLVDSNVLLDVFTNDERWSEWSATHLARAFDAGPVIVNPIIYAELSVGFARIEELEDALPAEIEREDLPWSGAFLAGRCFVQYRRRGGARRSPLAAAGLLHRSACCGHRPDAPDPRPPAPHRDAPGTQRDRPRLTESPRGDRSAREGPSARVTDDPRAAERNTSSRWEGATSRARSSSGRQRAASCRGRAAPSRATQVAIRRACRLTPRRVSQRSSQRFDRVQ